MTKRCLGSKHTAELFMYTQASADSDVYLTRRFHVRECSLVSLSLAATLRKRVLVELEQSQAFSRDGRPTERLQPQ